MKTEIINGVELQIPTHPRPTPGPKKGVPAPLKKAIPNVAITPEKLNKLRDDILVGSIKPKSAKALYRGGSIYVFAAKSGIKLKGQIWDKFKKSPRWVTCGEFSLFGANKITQDNLDQAVEKFAAEKRAAQTLFWGERKDKDKAKKYAETTNREFFQQWMRLPKARELKTFGDMCVRIQKDFLDFPVSPTRKIGDVPPSYFGEDEAQEWVTAIYEQRGQAAAKKARSYVMAMFNLLKKQKKITKRASFPETEPIDPCDPREVFISKHDLPQFWNAITTVSDNRLERSHSLSQTQSDFALVALLTCQRISQIQNLEWSWVNFKDEMIYFPASAMKGKKPRPFDCPITQPVIDILKRRQMSKFCKYVFASESIHGTPIANLPRLAARIDAILAGIPHKNCDYKNRDQAPFDWCWHDFRRTAIHFLESSDDPLTDSLTVENLEVILAHSTMKSGKAIKSYASGKLNRQKRLLFELYHRELFSIVDPAHPYIADRRSRLLVEKQRIEYELQRIAS